MCTKLSKTTTFSANVSPPEPQDEELCHLLKCMALPKLQEALNKPNLEEAAAHITHMQLLIYREWKNRETLLHDPKNSKPE